MGWFGNQIELRKQKDNEAFSYSFENVAGAVMGKRLSGALQDESFVAQNAINVILHYLHVKEKEVPAKITDLNERLEFQLRPYGIMRRRVRLEGEWYKDAMGAMLGTRKSDQKVAALLPMGVSGYGYYDIESGKLIRINRKNAALFETDAQVFYKPFPLEKLGIPSLLRYTFGTLAAADYIFIAVLTLLIAVVGMFTPMITNILFSEVVGSGSIRLLQSVMIFSFCVVISGTLLKLSRKVITQKVDMQLSVYVQSATMMRILSLPASFFKEYSAGDLQYRVSGMNTLCNLFMSSVVSTGLTSVFSFVYLFQILRYSSALVWPALFFTFLTMLATLLFTCMQMGLDARIMKKEGENSGLVFSMIEGIQKIKLAGAEKRMFARWGNRYADYLRLKYDKPFLLKINSTIILGISLVSTVVLYYAAIKHALSVSDYYAFQTAYGLLSGAMMALANIAMTISTILPILEMVRPIMDAEPERAGGTEMVENLRGNIELSNVSFRYREDMPKVLDNISLKIKAGQYVGVVGKTGCGKSTLIRLLLGFEKPQKGAIYYDNRDMAKLELKSLRRRIGTVIQNGTLFQGDIYSNIVISAPWLTLADAWEAAELAGIAEDIRRMPMGMHTMVSGGAGGISGGQRQRLMIARAIVPKPKILIFDEATSALDNITQKRVSESLDSLKCTRIVVAHRLSTIKHCDRIIVLDQGKIVEDGSYEELITKKGFFAELVERQRLDAGEQ